MRKGSFVVGLGGGTRSHVGTFGVTGNIFLLRVLNVKLSAGIGAANYNGALASIGPEYCQPVSSRFYLFAGSTFTGALGNYDVIGDDDKPDHHFYRTKCGRYLRNYAGAAFGTGSGIVKLEAGYSLAIKQPSYTLYGPGAWSAADISRLERGIGSGLLVTVSFQVVLQKAQQKRKK